MVMLAVRAESHNLWADPSYPLDYPILDIGYYPMEKGHGNCYRCLSLSKKSLFAISDPDCRKVPFKDAPLGQSNVVKMAKAGGCYEDNPANYV